jgi:hypoxanthine phosphoribosyltransferase
MNNNAVRTELLNIYTYLDYLLQTVDKLLEETPTDTAKNIYQAAWLSKCLNLQEILTIFQNQIINKREKFNLVLDKALKELNNDVDTKIQTNSLEEASIREHTKDLANATIVSSVNALDNMFSTLEEDLQKKFEITEAAIISHGKEIHEIKNYLQQELIPAVIKLNSLISQETTQPSQVKEQEEREEEYKKALFIINEGKKDKENQVTIKGITKEKDNKPPKWINYIDEVKQKMKGKGWSEHEVSERAKINFNSFRKFQRKDPKLTNGVVNKILKLFEINY